MLWVCLAPRRLSTECRRENAWVSLSKHSEDRTDSGRLPQSKERYHGRQARIGVRNTWTSALRWSPAVASSALSRSRRGTVSVPGSGKFSRDIRLHCPSVSIRQWPPFGVRFLRADLLGTLTSGYSVCGGRIPNCTREPYRSRGDSTTRFPFGPDSSGFLRVFHAASHPAAANCNR